MYHRKPANPVFSSPIEPLEARRLLSAGLVKGTLTVDGTSGNDVIVHPATMSMADRWR